MTLSLFRGYEQSRLQFHLVRQSTSAIFQLKLSAFVVGLLLLPLGYHVAHANYALRHPTSVLRLEKDKVSSFTKFRQRLLVQVWWRDFEVQLDGSKSFGQTRILGHGVLPKYQTKSLASLCQAYLNSEPSRRKTKRHDSLYFHLPLLIQSMRVFLVQSC